MVLRIDPDLPLVWRSPTVVQLGVERRVAELTLATTHEEYGLELLRRGVSRAGLDSLLADHGAPPGCAASLLSRLEGALLLPERARPGHREGLLEGEHVVVDGRGVAAEVIAGLLQRAGAVLVDQDGRAGSQTAKGGRVTAAGGTGAIGLAVVVSAFATSPRRSATWLRRDIPHLLVEFGDRTVRIGPVVVAGAGPCAQCIEQHRRDSDPAWPALAAQLHDRAAPSADALGIAAVAPLVVQLAAEHLHRAQNATEASEGWEGRALRWHHPALAASRIAAAPAAPPRATASSGGRWITVETVRRHPSCGCRFPSGSATEPDRSPGGGRPPPTTARAAGERG
jgi:bacteriocin biosynthesis cyclodehydratase domain-containing protein